MVGGLVASLLTALTGLWDAKESSEAGTQARRTINTHATIMITATVLALITVIWRLSVYGDELSTPIGILVLSLLVAGLVVDRGDVRRHAGVRLRLQRRNGRGLTRVAQVGDRRDARRPTPRCVSTVAWVAPGRVARCSRSRIRCVLAVRTSITPTCSCAGATGAVLRHRVMAPSTIGTILRSFTFGHCSSTEAVIGHRNRGRVVHWRRMYDEAAAILGSLDIDLDPRASGNSLAVAAQQTVEIAKAISLDARVLIMDEPTASLSAHEVNRLFDQVHRLRARGVAVLFISHRLDEVFSIADRITVFRDGRHISTRPVADTRPDAARARDGRPRARRFLRAHPPRAGRRAPAGRGPLPCGDRSRT